VLVENSVQSKKVSNARKGRTLRGLLNAKGYKDPTRRFVAMVKCGETPCASLFADNHYSRSFSGCPPLVSVVETAELRNRHNWSEFGRLHYPRFRRVLRQREMRSGTVIIFRKDFTCWYSADSLKMIT
jgi:hypothetical protein